MQYTVTKQYLRGTEMLFASFTDLSEADFFVQAKLAADLQLNVYVVYRIKRNNESITEYDPKKTESSTEQSGSGKSSSASFRPTPFNMAPTPSGTPKKWLHDDDDEKSKK